MMHPLYDIEITSLVFHTTDAKLHDANAMDVIPYEESSYYIFDRGYNDFKRLFKIDMIKLYFIIRAKRIYNSSQSNGNFACPRMYDTHIELTGYCPKKRFQRN